MNVVYEIILKPIGSFYFGGEESFSDAPLIAVKNSNDDKTKEYFKKRQGYFAKSEKFPQQTQLLGMIRKEILRANKKLLYFKNFVRVPSNLKTTAFDLVGKVKWTPTQNANLGAIEKLSPLYIAKDENSPKLYFKEPFNGEFLLEEKEGTGYINGKPTGKVYSLKDCNNNYFDAKTYLSSTFVASKNDSIDEDELFIPHTRTHTQTLPYSEDDEEKLFKVKRYNLHNDYSFLFYLTTTQEVFKDGFLTTVSIGGEDSYFSMYVKKVDQIEEPDTAFLQSKDSRITLISDAYIKSPITLKDDGDEVVEEGNIFELCKVILADKTIFRTIKTRQDNRSFTKSQKFILFKKGTVFYPKEGKEDEVKNILSRYTNFRKIGYNHYIDLTKGEKHGN